MHLTRRERFSLKSQMVEVLDSNQAWDFRRTNLLLAEYNCESLGGWGNDDFGFEDSIQNVSDADLIEMYSVITGVEQEEVRDTIQEVDSALWKPGYVRLFLSHSAAHKGFVGKVANELAVSGIHAFVAHDTMEYEQPWQSQIEAALASMQAFVALIHPESLGSAWCHQEVGWALGRRVPRYVVRIDGTDPAGFVGRTQWPSVSGANYKEVAQAILEWVSKTAEFSEQITDGLFAALRVAGNYIDAGATASRIATLDDLTSLQWEQLSEIYHANDQVYGAGLVGKALAPFYRKHGRSWPPATPHVAPPTDTTPF